MFPVELLEKIFSDEEMMKCPIGMQSTILHSLERIIDESGYRIVKSDLDREVQEQ